MIDRKHWENKLGRRYFTRKEVWEYFQIFKVNSLKQMDCNGTGINNKQSIGRTVIYPIVDVIEFLNSRITED